VPQRHAEIVEIVAGPLHRAVAHAPASAAQARPAQFAQAHRARRGGGVGEQPAALALAADQMFDADVIGHLPQVDGGDRPVRAVDHEHGAIVRLGGDNRGRKSGDGGAIGTGGASRGAAGAGCSHGLTRGMLRHFLRSV
jgi:hypothetical protein